VGQRVGEQISQGHSQKQRPQLDQLAYQPGELPRWPDRSSFDVGGVTMAPSLIDEHIQAVTNKLRTDRCDQYRLGASCGFAAAITGFPPSMHSRILALEAAVDYPMGHVSTAAVAPLSHGGSSALSLNGWLAPDRAAGSLGPPGVARQLSQLAHSKTPIRGSIPLVCHTKEAMDRLDINGK